MYVTASQFAGLALVVSAIESDLHSLWSVLVMLFAVNLAALVVMLLDVLRRR